MVVKKVKTATHNFLKDAFSRGVHDYITWAIRAILIAATIYLFNIAKNIPTSIGNVKQIPQIEQRLQNLEQVNHDRRIMDSMRKELRRHTEQNFNNKNR